MSKAYGFNNEHLKVRMKKCFLKYFVFPHSTASLVDPIHLLVLLVTLLIYPTDHKGEN
jgi:hypothetical protein